MKPDKSEEEVGKCVFSEARPILPQVLFRQSIIGLTASTCQVALYRFFQPYCTNRRRRPKTSVLFGLRRAMPFTPFSGNANNNAIAVGCRTNSRWVLTKVSPPKAVVDGKAVAKVSSKRKKVTFWDIVSSPLARALFCWFGRSQRTPTKLHITSRAMKERQVCSGVPR